MTRKNTPGAGGHDSGQGGDGGRWCFFFFFFLHSQSSSPSPPGGADGGASPELAEGGGGDGEGMVGGRAMPTSMPGSQVPWPSRGTSTITLVPRCAGAALGAVPRT